MDNKKQLTAQVQQFYEAYHQYRIREPDTWMYTQYWPLFQGTTLEVGSGRLLATYRPYFATDLTLEATRQALKAGIPALISDGQQLPLADMSFDTVACYDVLEHIVDPRRFLSEMCRVSRYQVVVAGPNYVGEYDGGLDRHLLKRLWVFISGHGNGYVLVNNPHLIFNSHWQPDRDAVCRPNASYVARQLKLNGYGIKKLHTWEHAYPLLNKIPVIRNLGQFMLVVGIKRGS